MAVDDISVVDLISITGARVTLTISDHLDWSDAQQHLEILKEKIGTYCQYIENGQLYEEYPEARDLQPLIRVVFFHQPPEPGRRFLTDAKAFLCKEGLALKWGLTNRNIDPDGGQVARMGKMGRGLRLDRGEDIFHDEADRVRSLLATPRT